jgi:DNA-binding NarL/FixJ family response regulator
MKGTKPQRISKTRRRILIVDDHPITRHGLTQLLNIEPDLMVCGEAENVKQALAAVDSLKPDLALVDITLPGKSGLEFIKDMRVLQPQLAILVVSMHDETLYAERALRAGARGYVMKSEGGARMLQAIRRVLHGEYYVSQRLSADLVSTLSASKRRPGGGAVSRLTDREFEVFQKLSQGLTSREIGERLHISSKTVDTHRLNIKQKFRLRSMPELIQYAVRWGATQGLI